jgi:hypothetical protein
MQGAHKARTRGAVGDTIGSSMRARKLESPKWILGGTPACMWLLFSIVLYLLNIICIIQCSFSSFYTKQILYNYISHAHNLLLEKRYSYKLFYGKKLSA